MIGYVMSGAIEFSWDYGYLTNNINNNRRML